MIDLHKLDTTNLLDGVLCITCVTVGNKLVVASTWFLLVGLTSACGMALAACPTSILAACDSSRSYLACLAKNSSIVGFCSPVSFWCGTYPFHPLLAWILWHYSMCHYQILGCLAINDLEKAAYMWLVTCLTVILSSLWINGNLE